MKIAMLVLVAVAASAPLFAQAHPKELTSAFEAVKRIPSSARPDDGYAQRRLEAEKALDAAYRSGKSDEDKRLATLLRAAMESRVVTRMPRSDDPDVFRLQLSFTIIEARCEMEMLLAFSPADLTEKQTETARQGRCVPDYESGAEKMDEMGGVFLPTLVISRP